jgi:hypothetical protein
LAQGGKHKYRGNLPQYFNPRISRVKITMVNSSREKFYNIDTRIGSDDGGASLSSDDIGLKSFTKGVKTCYITFYGCNLQVSMLS